MSTNISHVRQQTYEQKTPGRSIPRPRPNALASAARKTAQYSLETIALGNKLIEAAKTKDSTKVYSILSERTIEQLCPNQVAIALEHIALTHEDLALTEALNSPNLSPDDKAELILKLLNLKSPEKSN